MIARASLSRTRRIQLVAGLLAPVIGFVVLLRALGNATEALAVTDSIPMLWVLAYALWRRRIEPLGATAATLAAIALLLTIALGGSPLPLELHHAVFPGTVGLACLISLAARRPLLSIALARLAKRSQDVAAEDRPGARASHRPPRAEHADRPDRGHPAHRCRRPGRPRAHRLRIDVRGRGPDCRARDRRRGPRYLRRLPALGRPARPQHANPNGRQIPPRPRLGSQRHRRPSRGRFRREFVCRKACCRDRRRLGHRTRARLPARNARVLSSGLRLERRHGRGNCRAREERLPLRMFS